MSTKIANIYSSFLISRQKDFILLNFLPDCLHCQAYSFSPSSPRTTRAESNTESGIFTNILHSK